MFAYIHTHRPQLIYNTSFMCQIDREKGRRRRRMNHWKWIRVNGLLIFLAMVKTKDERKKTLEMKKEKEGEEIIALVLVVVQCNWKVSIVRLEFYREVSILRKPMIGVLGLWVRNSFLSKERWGFGGNFDILFYETQKKKKLILYVYLKLYFDTLYFRNFILVLFVLKS